MSGDLKPCPFCGGEPIEDKDDTTPPQFPCDRWVFCGICGATGPRAHSETWPDTNSEAAVAGWNARAELDQFRARLWVKVKAERRVAGETMAIRAGASNAELRILGARQRLDSVLDGAE